MNKNLNIKSFLDNLKNNNTCDYLVEPKIKEISIAPRMTSTMPMPFNNQPTDRILDNNYQEENIKKEITLQPRMTSTMPMPFNNQPIDRIKTIDTFNPKNNY